MKDCLEDHFMKGINSKFTQIIFFFFYKRVRNVNDIHR